MIRDDEAPPSQWDRDQLSQYDLAVEAMMQGNPHLSRAAASRRVNELMEIADPNGRKALGTAAWRSQGGGLDGDPVFC
jgi:hypothetical protein